VAFVSAEFGQSERTACKLLGVDRSSYRYEPRPDRNAELREELMQLARQKPRFGYRRLHAILERRGERVNVKRIYRLYTEAGLAVRRRRRKRLVRDPLASARLTRPNQEWAMDFIVDGLANGRMVRILSVVDAFTRECLALEPDVSLGSGRVTRCSMKSSPSMAAPRVFAQTTGRSSARGGCWAGPRNGRSRWCTSSRGGRCRMGTWRVSTGGCATNV